MDAPERRRDDAVADLFVEHHAALRRVAFLLLGDAGRAEEIVMDAFVKTMSGWGSFRAVRDPSLYLRRMVVNACRSRHRRAAVERRAYALLGRRSETPRHDLELVGEPSSVWSAVRALPERQQACVVLRYVDDLTENEIAAILDIPVGSVKSALSRARRRLARSLNDPLDEATS